VEVKHPQFWPRVIINVISTISTVTAVSIGIISIIVKPHALSLAMPSDNVMCCQGLSSSIMAYHVMLTLS
jgi:hypothetical protein